MSYRLESFDFDHAGKTFLAEIYTDNDMGAPWENSDWHGIVSDWETRSKLPGEWVLCEDRRARRFYDAQETMKKARADSWGLSDPALIKLCEALGRQATRGEIVAAAVRADFEFLRGWCDGEWYYVGVCVQATGADCNAFENALWGVESGDTAYIREVAAELASEIE